MIMVDNHISVLGWCAYSGFPPSLNLPPPSAPAPASARAGVFRVLGLDLSSGVCHCMRMAPASKILSIRVPPEIADELAELAAADGRTLSQFCARILTAAVADRAAA